MRNGAASSSRTPSPPSRRTGRSRRSRRPPCSSCAIPWSDVVTFARSFPTVPMVVVGVEGDRVAGAALDATANLVLHGAGVASLAATFGAHRFVDDETAAALLSGEWGSTYL